MRFRHLLLASAIVAAPPAVALGAAPRYGTWGVATEDMDRSVKPGDDFFVYAEGTWLKNHPIPADKTGTGYNYELPDEIEQQVKTMVERLAANPNSPVAQKIGDAYAAWMDESGIEARGLEPLKPYLAKIDSVETKKQLVELMAQPGYAAPIGLGITADQDDPTRYTVRTGQARQGLPTRDYYLLKGEKYDAIRKAYRAYIVQIGKLAGLSDPEGRADRIIALETSIAKDQWTPEQRRDPVATHNVMDRAKLMKLAPEFDWDATLRSVGLESAKTVDVAETTAVAAAGKRIGDVPLSTWKEYLTFRFISDHASYLPKAFDNARFGFYSHTLNDVAEHWPDATARQAQELVDDVRAAYGEKIANADWMDEPTRKAALEKLGSFDPRIGHPVKWIDYSNLKISRNDVLANAVEADRFQWQLQLSRFPNTVDRTLWDMTPQTVKPITTRR